MMMFIFTKLEEYQSQNDKISFDKFKSDFNTLRLQTSTKLSEVLIYFSKVLCLDYNIPSNEIFF